MWLSQYEGERPWFMGSRCVRSPQSSRCKTAEGGNVISNVIIGGRPLLKWDKDRDCFDGNKGMSDLSRASKSA